MGGPEGSRLFEGSELVLVHLGALGWGVGWCESWVMREGEEGGNGKGVTFVLGDLGGLAESRRKLLHL